ncbi:hypothetical protein TrLO_g11798 [Triparma laevis f. longispina]|uniref:Sialidase domain-containing protein n=1 Tax=Triparma laevis f. longispina TaxID=1714387 RepID=A0A9W7CH89_9STRA|nr:hypothetical protein TrLO_g11798 [Triparma laevis f. longispina]
MKLFVIFAALLGGALATPPTSNVDVFKAGDVVNPGASEEKTYFCTKIPTILRTPKGDLLAWGEARVGSCADVAPTDLVMRRSTDEGSTWSDLTIFQSHGNNTSGNIAPVSVPSINTIFAPFTIDNRATWMTKSVDDGLTWSEPFEMPDMRKDDWIWVGLGPPAGLLLRSGKILIPGYHNTISMGNGSSLGSGFTKGHTMMSDDNGETWYLGSEEFGDHYYVNELQAAQLPDDRVIVNSRVLNDKRVLSISEDEGLTFKENRIADTLRQTFQGCEGSMIYHSTQNLLLYSGVQGRLPLRIYRENMTIFESKDEGETWSLNSIVDLGSSAYSAMLQVGEDVGILYERSECEKHGKEKCPVIFLPEAISYRVVKL